LAAGLTHKRPWQIGSPTGGGIGSVMVNPVATIPLPNPGGPKNPVANDTASQVPSPLPEKTKPSPKVKLPPPDAIPLKGAKAPKRPSEASAQSNKFREKQQFDPNQLYTTGGQRMSSPSMGINGGGTLTVGDNSPFGLRFGQYATLIRDNVSRMWRTSDLDPRLQNAPPVVVTFRILQDGSVTNVKVPQPSGIGPLDISARRAVYDAKLPPLPLGFPQDHADVELRFELRR